MKRTHKTFTNKRTKPTDRIRAKGSFVQQRTNAWAGNVGFLAGRGYFSREIADRMADGTHPATIRKSFQRWGLPIIRHKGGFFIPFSPKMKARIDALSKQYKTTPEEIARRIIVCVVDDEMYEAVNDGRFKD